MPLVAGVDSSTQSCTVVLRDLETGAVVAAASAPHPATTPPVSEQHPHAWWQALTAALRSALAAADVKQPPVAIGIDGQGHGLVILDREGQVIRPAKLWNDTTSTPEAEELVQRLGAATWARRVGSVPTAAFTITKLLWLARHEPASFARICSVLLPHDWLTYRLTGLRFTDRSEASGTAYFSPALASWQPDLLALVDETVDWLERLPAIAQPGEPVGHVLPEAAEATGLVAGTPVIGLHDNAATALGLALQSGDVVVSLGTSGTVFAPHPLPVADETGAVDGNADATGQFLPLVCTLNATKVTDMVARLLGVDHQRLAELALEAPARPDRAILLAYLDGERTPNRPYSRGVLAGLRSDLSAGELARAAFEGVLCGLYQGLLALQRLGIATGGRLILAGGGSASPAYRQFTADLFQRPVYVADLPYVTACGAAVLAAAMYLELPIQTMAARWAPPYRLVAEPRAETPEILLERYQRLAKGEYLEGF
jgi:xylulokinase